MSKEMRDDDPVRPREPELDQQDQQGEQDGGAPDPALLAAQLAEAERERDQFRAMAQRAQADLANYRRRAAEYNQQALFNSKADILEKFLGVLDDYDRAIDMMPQGSGWYEGFTLVQHKLFSVLESEGVSKIDAVGKPFDPREHEALAYQETLDFPDGAIAVVTRDGYRLANRLLRPAQVFVAKTPRGDRIPPADTGDQPNSQTQ